MSCKQRNGKGVGLDTQKGKESMNRYFFSLKKFKSWCEKNGETVSDWAIKSDGKEVKEGKIVGTFYACSGPSIDSWCICKDDESGCTQKIIITSDGKTTTALLVDGKKTVKTAQAVCSDSDTFDFTTGAKIAFERLTADEKKPEKHDFEIKVGDKVKIRTWESMEKEFGLDKDGDINIRPCFFTTEMKQYCGKTLTVARIDSDGLFNVKEDIHGFYFCKKFIECVVNDNPEKQSVHDIMERFKKEKIAVRTGTGKNLDKFLKMCEEEGLKWYSGHNATQYRPNGYKKDLCICYANKCALTYGSSSLFEPKCSIIDFDDFVRVSLIRKPAVKEVHRKAKVGEYIKILTDGLYGNYFTVGKVYEVEEIKGNLARIRKDDGSQLLGFATHQYVVLEGYKPDTEPDKEPEKPKYLNGKVVCIKSGYSWWTVGKVYDVKDGIITADDGDKYPKRGAEPYKDFDDIRHAGNSDGNGRTNPDNEFIEFKG